MHSRVEIKNLGGGKQQLIFNKVEMEDDGEILCESGKLSSSCKLTVKKGESKPQIDCPDDFAGTAGHPFVIEVPYKSKLPHMHLLKNICSIGLMDGMPEIYRNFNLKR